MLVNFAKKIFGTKNEREIKRLKPLVEKTNQWEEAYKKLSDDELKNHTALFRARLEKGEAIISVAPEAFATVREASRRVLGMRHFDVQLLGGFALSEGKISEMRTGEGKTLTATLPTYLHALTGKGSHVITVNDYLARRDAESMGKLYGALGMSTGLIVHGLSDTQRRQSYGYDITYGTNNEFGFDYLRDNMKTEIGRLVQRGHYFAIVDEVDSILIDEARTPLIISGPTESNSQLYGIVNSAIPGLQKDSDYIIDEKERNISLTEDGISKLERRLRVENLYDPKNIDYLHHIQQAMKAHFLFKKDVEYVVRDNKVLIVDEFTGRLMPGRRYSDGLHGALEAKEHLPVENENQTMATVTFQNYFRMYQILSGMTGTADTEAVEFKKIYNLDVLVIPTNRNMIRIDQDDVIYRSAREKFNVIADDIAERQVKGQPVLVGTVSVERSELLSGLLKKRNIPHEILNAKNHAREAQIIEQAGQKGNVTISTNMAGRGTDIVLGPGVRELGGLYVVGTERHESRRIDNQLRGRSGRQGDTGESRFYLSLEDDLMRIFAKDWLSSMMGMLGMKENEAIISPMVTRAIEKAQRRVEEQNFASRKHLLEYDDVMNQQRQVIYGRRRSVLERKANLDFFERTIEILIGNIVDRHDPEKGLVEHWEFEKLESDLQREFNQQANLKEMIGNIEPSSGGIITAATAFILKAYRSKLEGIPEEIVNKLECYVYLQVIDSAWKDHLLAMDHLKDSVRLRGYGQRDPLQEYKREAFQIFEMVMNRIEDETTLALLRMPKPQLVAEPQFEVEEPEESELSFQHPDAPTALLEPTSAVPDRQPSPLKPSARPSRHQPSEDGMIYHGSRESGSSSPQNRQQQAAPVKRASPKVGRNDPCPCGSGKKYKKCHGADEQADAR